MKKSYFLLLTICSSLLANEESRKEYLALINTHPEIVMPIGNSTKGEIEILLDPEKMAEIETKTGRDVGVLKKDPYWIWLNDACRFPDQREGVIGRIVARHVNRLSGAAILPILPNGKIALNCEFRHSTRNWELEMPRGGIKSGEQPEAAARRELLEETGLIADQLIYLGEVTGDSGVTGMNLAIFMGKISDQQQPDRESSEAINQTLVLSPSEIKEAFIKGYITCTIEGEMRQVNARDPFLAYAMTFL